MALEDDVLGYWRLDEESGLRVDTSPNGRDLTDVNTVTFAAGKLDNAAQFNRTNNERLARTDTGLRITGPMSVQAWVYETAAQMAGNQASFGAGVVSHLTSDTLGDWFVSVLNSGRLVFTHFENSGADTDGRIYFRYSLFNVMTITPDAWNHIVIVRGSGSGPTNVTPYLNGVSGELDGIPGSSASGWGVNGFNIGMQWIAGADYAFSGLVDEVAVWDRALTSSEVSQLYNGGTGRRLYLGTAFRAVRAIPDRFEHVLSGGKA